MRSACNYLAVPLCVLFAACTHGQLPLEVDRFVQRRDTCEHFRGEIPEAQDAERMKEVGEMLVKYCAGTDAELAALRTRYYANGTVTEKLSVYETKIEAKK